MTKGNFRLGDSSGEHENASSFKRMADGESDTIEENDNNDGEKKDKKARPMVGMAEVFRFSDALDKILIVVGIITSCAHGAAMPLLIIVFGSMADTFIGNGKFDDFWNDFGPNITEHYNVTKEELMANPKMLHDVLCNISKAMCDLYEELEKTLQDDFMSQMNTYTIYYCVLGCIVLTISYVQLTGWMLSSYRQCQRIRTLLLTSVLKQEIGWFDTHEINELNTRLADDVQQIEAGIGDKFGLFFQWMCSFIAGFTVGFYFGWKLTLVILAISPLLAISGGIMGKLGAAFTSKELKAYAKAGSVAEETLGAIRTVTAFGGQEKECDRYNSNLRDAKKFGVRKGVISGISMGLVFFILFCAYALAFWYGSQLVRQGEYTGGTVLTVFFAVLIGAFSIGNAAPNLEYFATARGAAYAVYGIIDQKPLIDSSSTEGKTLPNMVGNIGFHNVHFNYPSRPGVKVLEGLNLKISVGQTVALVGSSGCGKSTTVQLLQRFYDPHEGQILIDGVDIRELNVQWLRQNIGVVSQEPILFGTTIAENIRYGKEGVSMEDIQKAAKNANAHDFIMKLPKHYETLVGERGAQLSGGQKQRVAIARALIRDPKILLLDEATSALDTESEAAVQAALDNARLGRTTLVIAHRLSTVRNADIIVGIYDGKVAEKGTHDELMQLEGIYYQLVTNQTRMDEEGDYSEEDREAAMVEDLASGFEVQIKRALSRTTSQGSRKSFEGSGSFKHSVMGNRSMSVESMAEEEVFPEAALGRIMKLNAPEWPYILFGCLAALVSGGIQPIFAVIFSSIIGVFSEVDMEKQEREANFYSLMFVCIGVAAGSAIFFQSVLFAKSGEELTLRLRRLAFKAYMRQEIGYFDEPRHGTGVLTTRLASDASAVRGATGTRLATIIQSMSSILAGLAIGFYYSWQLALVICAFAPFVLIAGAVQMKTMMGSATKDKEALEEAGKIAVEAIGNIRTVATLTKEETFIQAYIKRTEVPYKRNTRMVHVQAIAWGLSQGIIFFAYGACFRFGAYLIENGELEFGDMYKVITAIIFSAMAAGQASSFAPDYGKAKLSAAKLFSLLDREPEIDSSMTTGEQPELVEGNLLFEDVRFHYPTRPGIPVLRGLTVSISRGQTLALVGSSGCGKSTSVSLVERYYDPLSGLVKLDGTDLKDLNPQWMRAQLGLVQQEPILFDTSIAENIEYGDNRRHVSMDEVIAAARDANIHDFISSLPQGYNTNVGDRGTQLSGGQKQRVAIARALVRKPAVLLLDEATSALDTESEKVVQEALDKAREGRTCIVIAHRLSTIQDADKIAVVHNGKVAEIGTHVELMALQGHYYRLNMVQAARKQQ